MPKLPRSLLSAKPTPWTHTSTAAGICTGISTRTTRARRFNPEIAKKWEPIDFYNGADHATAHLLYARFLGHFFKKLIWSTTRNHLSSLSLTEKSLPAMAARSVNQRVMGLTRWKL
jgi:hypothetical protein